MIAALVAPGLDLRVGLTVELDEEEAHHLKVRRVPPGATLRLLDGIGLLASGTLLDGRSARVALTDVRRVPAPARLELAVGAGDKERFAWLAEKATELGVTTLVPVETARTVHVASRVRAAQVARLARRALEATKQSGAPWATQVEAPVPLGQYLAGDMGPVRWLAEPDGELAPAALGAEAVAVLVGPEGGLTDAERAAALVSGFRPMRLGDHILRFETAALAAAAHVGVARTRGGEGG